MGISDQLPHTLPTFDPDELLKEGFEITTDRGRIDVDQVHQFLTRSYWAAGCSREQVEKALNGSKCFAIFWRKKQVAFGRVITDYATFAYVSDVFVEADYRGRGLGKLLVATMLAHPDLQGLRKWNLHTRDAHGLYTRFGFIAPGEVPTYMEYRP